MPKPVPPPPPQPSAEETQRAVRLSRMLAVVAVLFFGLLTTMVRSDSFFVEYGRKNGASWNLKALSELDEEATRAHEGGRVLWLVGSSMLRDSFDVKVINQGLEAAESPYRAVKFGQTRGAASLSRGILARLPLKEGDLVLHGMCMVNLRKDWLNYIGLPDWRVLMMMEDHQVWAIEDWSVQQKIEALVARPQSFYMYQEESMEGMARWAEGFIHKQRAPKPPKGLNHLKWRKPKKRDKKRTEDVEEESIELRYMDESDLDLSDAHINIAGLADIRRITAAAGADLAIVEHPGRPSFKEIFASPEAVSVWETWWDAQEDTVRFPQPPEDGFYDMTHPGPRGRALLSAYLVEWVTHRSRTPPADWVKNRKRSTVRPPAVLDKPASEQ